MADKARKIQAEILRTLPANKRLFPINAGMGWCGEVIRRDSNTIILKNPRPLHAAPPGWPDLCGWETIEITADMVGQKIAVFCAEEIKAGKDRLRPDQSKFKRLIEAMGGIFRVVGG